MKQILKTITPVFFLFFLASCLKDKGFENQKYGLNDPSTTRYVNFVKSYERDGNNVVGILTSPVEENYDFFVLNITGERLSTPITVNIAIDNTIITEFNTANGTNYIPLPSANYELPLSFTYPAGVDFLPVQIKLKKGTLDVTKAYSLGVKITGTSDASIKLSTNANKRLISFLIKNKYDGNYGLRIRTVGWAAYGISDNLVGTWPSNGDGTSIFMITSGANTVDFWDEWGFGTYIQPAFTTGNASATGFGATSPRFVFDLTTDKLTDVFNTTPDDGRGRRFSLNPAVTDSRYDPAAKIIYAAYRMHQNGRPDQFIYDTLTFRSQRP